MAWGRVLVVDDEADIVEVVHRTLAGEGLEVLVARDGRTAISMAEREKPDVIVLDVMLPEMDGLSVCRELRKTHQVPILILSARGDDFDKVLGLEIGADDYLSKPFNPKELAARVKAMLRRRQMTAAPEQAVITRGALRVDTRTQQVLLNGSEVMLTPTEYGLLRTLAANPGVVHTRQDLLTRVWGEDFFGDERTVDSHVRNLRAKLHKSDPHFSAIMSVWGVGYRFQV